MKNKLNTALLISVFILISVILTECSFFELSHVNTLDTVISGL